VSFFEKMKTAAHGSGSLEKWFDDAAILRGNDGNLDGEFAAWRELGERQCIACDVRWTL
jgi:hypothetical protein